MADIALLCTDGSELATAALKTGRGLLRPDITPVVVTVIDPADTTLVTGTGFAGGTMSGEQLQEMVRQQEADGEAVVADAVSQLGLGDADTRVVSGAPGPAICDLAEELGAAVIVIGSRGQGGLKRAILGSVSDHVVRNAPCPVIVTSSD
jgi:nucleotide-binding universal stress UspA family protein